MSQNPVYVPSPTNPDIMVTVTQETDPAYAMLKDGHTTTPTVYKRSCYICNDPEFAQLGMSLCKACPGCGGHVPADDVECDDCGEAIEYEAALSAQEN